MRSPGRWSFLAALAGTLLAGLFVRAALVEPYRIPSSSMAPTLLAGDVVLVDKRAYRGRLPARGDVVLVEVLEDGVPRFVVKRVAGLPGEKVELSEDGSLQLDGRAVPREARGEVRLGADGEPLPPGRGPAPAVLFEEHLGARPHEVLELRLPARLLPGEGRPETFAGRVLGADELFLLGDHRGASLDSRSPQLGPVSSGQVRGRVFRVLYSSAADGLRAERWLRPVR